MTTATATASPAPPLSRRQEAVRLAVALLIGVVLFVASASHMGVWLIWADVAAGLVAVTLAHWRRRWPMAIAIVVNAITFASSLGSGAAVLTLASLATRRRWREIIPASAVAWGTGVAWETFRSGDLRWWVVMAMTGVWVVAIVATGMFIGARRELVATLRERAERAEHEQGLRADQARTAERARIAREMHDVLAHRISLIAMHAGALAYREDLDATALREGAGLLRTTAHRALEDLREVLGVLRDDDPGAGVERPQPTLRDIPELVHEARSAGMRVEFRSTLADSEAVPDAVGRGAFRIVQEALTNAAKHAPGARVAVDLRREGDVLVVEAHNPLPVGTRIAREEATPGAGLGLVGLAERAASVGGSLVHGRTGDAFVLEARLPCAA